MTGPEPNTPDTPDSINQLVLAGDFGFNAVDGPFQVEKEGTIWTVVVPSGDLEPIRYDALKETSGNAVVLIADCEAVGGGLVTATVEPEGEGELHVIVDQYARGVDS